MNIFTRKHSYVLYCFLLAGCGKLEFSPNQKFDKDTPQHINADNIRKIQETPGDDTIRFVLSGDTQRAYENAEGFVNAVNQLKGVDFVVLDGDISDFGLLQEMEWVHEIYSKLHVPYVAVLGNHDVNANGEQVFKRMYGDINYSFLYKGTKFVCHNTNSREYNFNGKIPDIGWLETQFKAEAGVKSFVGIAHVPPSDGDFDAALKDKYLATVNGTSTTLGSFYAHINKATSIYPDEETGGPIITTDAISNRGFMVITIYDGKLHTENKTF